MKKDFSYGLIDLHLHLDGSISACGLIEMSKLSNVKLPTYDKEELKNLLTVPKKCESLNDYLKCFQLPLTVMQTKESLEYAIYDLIKRLNNQGLIYAEIRYAPQLHLENGLTQEEVVLAVIKGLNKGKEETGMKANTILCLMRGENNYKENLETITICKKYLNKGVVACDLAGAEGLFRTEKFYELFKYAKSLDVPFTIHAGESDGIASIKTAILFGAKRIGHGIRSYNSKATLKLLRKNNITLELCPTSNLQTKAVEEIKEMKNYPIKNFLDEKVLITINTDNMTVSNTTLKNELELLKENNLVDDDIIKKMLENSINCSFLEEWEKEELKNKIKDKNK